VLQTITNSSKKPLTLSAQATGSANGTTFTTVTFTVPATSFASDVEVRVLAAPISGGTGIRVEASGTVLSDNPVPSLLAAPSEVSVTVNRVTEAPVTRTLDAQAATTLARIISVLPVSSTAPRHCGADSQATSDTLDFTTASGHVTVADSVDGCRTIRVNGTGSSTSLDDTNGNLDAALLRALGLPANWG
jgi:hypothetical protein